MNLTLHCPAMPVINTSWWNPFAVHEAQELVCEGKFEDGREFILIFPKCKVKFEDFGKWMVDPVIAKGYLASGEEIEVHFPEEPVIREGWNMVALPITSIDGWVRYLDGTRPKVEMTLPRAVGRPVGLGLHKFIVDAVDVDGYVEVVAQQV